jgi:predicted nucleotidyltransferase
MVNAVQQAMLDRVLAAVRDDARIEALLGAGSMARGAFDPYSDFDFVVVEAEPIADRLAFADAMGERLTSFTGEHVGEPNLLICLYGPPLLHVDFKFGPRSSLGRFTEAPIVLWARDPESIARWLSTVRVGWPSHDAQWFEDRAWLWLHYGATKWLRGEYFEAISTLDFFRCMVLGPMLQRNAGQPMRGMRHVESLPGARGKLEPTLAGDEAKAIRRAFTEAAGLYVQLREAQPPPRPTKHMPEAFLDFLRP